MTALADSTMPIKLITIGPIGGWPTSIGNESPCDPSKKGIDEFATMAWSDGVHKEELFT